MAARVFVDENDLALGKALAKTRGDVVYPGHPDLVEVSRGSLDDAWLGVIGRRRLVVITRDQRIRYAWVWGTASPEAFVLRDFHGTILVRGSHFISDSVSPLVTTTARRSPHAARSAGASIASQEKGRRPGADRT